ncbi:hypothetical protein ACFVH4_06970 [Nocardia ignorata]|uniref:hypothetical protein n=1 Tax=Nocardia ignorata TaxID=145285 RepID=UPI00362A8AB9
MFKRKHSDNADAYAPSFLEIAEYLAAEGVEYPTDDDQQRARVALVAADDARRAAEAEIAAEAEQKRRAELCKVCLRLPGNHYDLNLIFKGKGPVLSAMAPSVHRVCPFCVPVIEAAAVAALASRDDAEGVAQRGANAAALVAASERAGWPKRDTWADSVPYTAPVRTVPGAFNARGELMAWGRPQ